MLSGCEKVGDYHAMTKTPQVCIEGTCINVVIADDVTERTKGLMFVESLPANEGMLFVFPTAGNFQFRMKNTLIPLDMIRIDDMNTIIHIEQNVQPCAADPCRTYGPAGGMLATYVLEVNAGVSQLQWRQTGHIVEMRQ